MPVTYASYLRLDELLSIQTPRSDGPEHDEMLFIVIHQVYELWFKEVLHELDFLMDRLTANDTPLTQHTFKRILTILKVLVAQIDVLETMTPLNFLSFRERLESGSGFQSFQFRELEFVLGNKRQSAVDHYPPDTAVHARLAARYQAPTLWDAFLTYLAHNGYTPRGGEPRDVTQPVEASDAIQDMLVRLYRESPPLAQISERMVDLDEGVQEWRYRHVKMVERTIGTKPGTGGSAGAEYLRTTLFKAAFPDLWAIRTRL